MKINGVVTRVFTNKDDKWFVFNVEEKENGYKTNYKCVGNAYGVEPGIMVQVDAEPKMDVTYGIEYVISSFKKEIAVSTEGIRSWLTSKAVKGIGPILTNKILDRFGADTLNVIRDNPEKLLEVHGMTPSKMHTIEESYAKQTRQIDIMNLVHGVCTEHEVEKIISYFNMKGEKAEKVLQTDPYRLCEIPGIGFFKADKIALGCGVDKYSVFRAQRAALYELNEIAGSRGDCYVSMEEMEKTTMGYLNRLNPDYSAQMEKQLYSGATCMLNAIIEDTTGNDIKNIKNRIEKNDELMSDFIGFISDLKPRYKDPEQFDATYEDLCRNEAVREKSKKVMEAFRNYIKTGEMPNESEGIMKAVKGFVSMAEKKKLDAEDMEYLSGWVERYCYYDISLTEAVETSIDLGEMVADNGLIASKNLYDAEKTSAKEVKNLLKREPFIQDRQSVEDFMKKYECDYSMTLAPEQKEAIKNALTNRISVITGGPGCGKTASIQVIVSYWKTHEIGNIYLCAPTGRAAQRIKELLNDDDIESCTVHKMTRLKPQDESLMASGDGDEDPYNENAPEAENRSLVLCDESSMLDIRLASRLLKFSKKANLVLVGDADQLPPVGPGNFFKDVIASGKVKTVRLTKCFRNSGLIAQNSRLINEGRYSDVRSGKGFRVNCFDNKAYIPDKALECYVNAIKNGEDKRDICLLTLQRTRGCVSVQKMNQMIQDTVNPHKQGEPVIYENGFDFRAGDRVMQIKNNYAAEYTTDGGEKGNGIFNGDLGIITGINERDNELEVLFDDGKRVRYEDEDLHELVLAYAMTVHKAQGSEFKHVIMTLSMDQYIMLSRAIVYTGVTRTIDNLDLFCEKKAFIQAVRTVKQNVRATRLQEMLKS